VTLLQAVPRPVIKIPRRPWRDWFLHEVEPLSTGAIETSPHYRRTWTKESPLRFALVYFEHHLVLQGHSPSTVTFNEMHLSLTRAAKQWMRPQRWREAWVAPRGVAKSTWALLALPLWALAHGHREYFMAFSHTGKMAERQLATLRMELDTNELLRNDFPELAPRRVRGAANTNRTVVANGGTIAAAGVGENTLGSKSGASRPDLVAIDDVEQMDDAMSEREKSRIITAITGSIIPMAAPHAAIGLFGTTTSYGSVIHDVAEHARGRRHVDWVADNDITARVFPGVLTDPDTGAERSLWPERWPLTETHLGEALRRTPDGRVPRTFELNYLLDPSPYGDGVGALFRKELIRYKGSHEFGGVFEHCMYIDTAPTATRNSDQNAIVIVGRDPAHRRAVVEYAWAGRVPPEKLRRRIHSLVERNPTIRTLIVETIQGSDLWRQVLNPDHDPLPPGLRYVPESSVKGSKVDRVRAALVHYEAGQVFHAREFVELEREMMLFPNPKINDDLCDALCGALRWAFA
jgi:hypothetical protein